MAATLVFCAALSPSPALLVARSSQPLALRGTGIVASESLAVTTSKAVAGIASAPVTWASLITLATTGCGLPGEAAGTLEGVAYLVVSGLALSSVFTRVATGRGLRDAELEAAGEELAQLEAAGASEQRKRFSAEKRAALADGPADLLNVAELLSLASVAAAILVLGGKLAITGSLPSAVPVAGGACWS